LVTKKAGQTLARENCGGEPAMPGAEGVIRVSAPVSAPLSEAQMREIGRSVEVSEAEAQSDRGIDVVALEKAVSQSAVLLREHDARIVAKA
jgi:hypothetical protein